MAAGYIQQGNRRFFTADAVIVGWAQHSTLPAIAIYEGDIDYDETDSNTVFHIGTTSDTRVIGANAGASTDSTFIVIPAGSSCHVASSSLTIFVMWKGVGSYGSI